MESRQICIDALKQTPLHNLSQTKQIIFLGIFIIILEVDSLPNFRDNCTWSNFNALIIFTQPHISLCKTVKSKMQCPKCKSHSVYIQNGTHICGVQGCTYADFHPISFENDVRQYEGEKNAANRYTSLYSNPMETGGVSVSREANFQKSFRSGVKMIQDHCHLYKICGRVQAIAEARFASILRIKTVEKQGGNVNNVNGIGSNGAVNGSGGPIIGSNGTVGKEGSGTSGNAIGSGNSEKQAVGGITNMSLGEKFEQGVDEKNSNQFKEDPSTNINGTDPNFLKQANYINEKFFSNEKLAAYSLYSACFQNQLFFEDYNIYHNWLKIEREEWRKILKELNNQMSQKIDYIPVQKTWHYTLRVCRKRKIAFAEERAMRIMCDNINKAVITAGSRRSTIAACVFWQVCAHSKKYKDTLTLNEICKKSKDHSEPIDEKDQQKYFDCTPDTVKAYFTNYIKKELYSRLLPKFEGCEFPPDVLRTVGKNKEKEE